MVEDFGYAPYELKLAKKQLGSGKEYKVGSVY